MLYCYSVGASSTVRISSWVAEVDIAMQFISCNPRKEDTYKVTDGFILILKWLMTVSESPGSAEREGMTNIFSYLSF